VSDIASALVPLLLVLPIIDWIATGVLVILAVQRPRIAFLTERAVIAVVVSGVTTVYGLVALNTQLGFPIFDADTAKVIVRLAIVVLGAAPIVWLALYLRRR